MIEYRPFTITKENRSEIGWTWATKELIIPATFVGKDGMNYKVEAIEAKAFFNCNLTSAYIPEGVKYIGSSAFSWCTKLEQVEIPSTVTEIKRGSFAHCYELKEIVLPEGLVTLGEGVFDSCIFWRK